MAEPLTREERKKIQAEVNASRMGVINRRNFARYDATVEALAALLEEVEANASNALAALVIGEVSDAESYVRALLALLEGGGR